MRTIPLLTGLACLTWAGASLAREPVHALMVQLPDGTVEQIDYVGAVPPTVVYQPQMASPFAAFDRIAAIMDAQMDEMMRAAASLSVMPASFGPGGGMCMQSVRVVYDGGRPEVTRSTAGDCGQTAAPAALPARPRPASGTILVDNDRLPHPIEIASR